MKNLYKIGIVIFFIIIILFINILNYFKIQQDNERYIEICSQRNENYSDSINHINELDNEFIGVINNPQSCYCRMYTRILPRLLVYKVKSNNKDLKFIRPSRGTCIIPTITLEKADAFISYGSADNTDFEYSISNLYKKNLYIYDNKKINIVPNNKYIFLKNYDVNHKIHPFKEKLKELKSEDKQIFVKINIDEYEIDTIFDIIESPENIIGLSFMIKFYDTDDIIKYEELLKKIEKNFVLVARNELPDKKYCNCNYKNKNLATVISVTYLNKRYVGKKYIPFKQSYNEKDNYKQLYKLGNYIPQFEISWILVLAEKMKLLFGKYN